VVYVDSFQNKKGSKTETRIFGSDDTDPVEETPSLKENSKPHDFTPLINVKFTEELDKFGNLPR